MMREHVYYDLGVTCAVGDVRRCILVVFAVLVVLAVITGGKCLSSALREGLLILILGRLLFQCAKNVVVLMVLVVLEMRWLSSAGRVFMVLGRCWRCWCCWRC